MSAPAVAGTLHQTLPTGIEAPEGGVVLAVLPWHCPGCQLVAAETVWGSAGRPMTVIVGYSPRRIPEAEQDGVPFYGPSPRRLRGKTERRSSERMRSGAFDRRGDKAQPDYGPVRLVDFETICWDCQTRMRITLPNR